MGWARIDDGFHDHPKVIGLSLEAIGLWTKCLTWAHRHPGATPGYIPQDLPRTFAGGRWKRLVGELTSGGLWDFATVSQSLATGNLSLATVNSQKPSGWVIHDYSDYLPAAERPASASAVSKARSEAGRRGAEARWGDSKPMASCHQDDGKPMASTNGKPMPPTRPEPEPEPELLEVHSASAAPTQIHDDGFEAFWDAYPRSESKKPAIQAWAKALKRGATAADLIAHIHRQKTDPARASDTLWPYAATWLNNDRWNDKFTSTSTTPLKPSTSDQKFYSTIELGERLAGTLNNRLPHGQTPKEIDA